jgi:hypothetical protein
MSDRVLLALGGLQKIESDGRSLSSKLSRQMAIAAKNVNP